MIRIVIAVALLGIGTASHAEPLKLATHYDDVGTNPDGSAYRGTVEIKIVSDTTFTIQWSVGSAVYDGFGMRMNDMVAATYNTDGIPGLVIYQVDPNGAMSGIWAVRGRNGNGTERLTPRD